MPWAPHPPPWHPPTLPPAQPLWLGASRAAGQPDGRSEESPGQQPAPRAPPGHDCGRGGQRPAAPRGASPEVPGEHRRCPLGPPRATVSPTRPCPLGPPGAAVSPVRHCPLGPPGAAVSPVCHCPLGPPGAAVSPVRHCPLGPPGAAVTPAPVTAHWALLEPPSLPAHLSRLSLPACRGPGRGASVPWCLCTSPQGTLRTELLGPSIH